MTQYLAEKVNELSGNIVWNSIAKGFWPNHSDPDYEIPRKLALIASEVSEALDAHRNPYVNHDGQAAELIDSRTNMGPEQTEDFLDELADIIIRTLDLANYYDLDIGNAIIEKVGKNSLRPAKHGKRY